MRCASQCISASNNYLCFSTNRIYVNSLLLIYGEYHAAIAGDAGRSSGLHGKAINYSLFTGSRQYAMFQLSVHVQWTW
jgi:hypothetical protein